MQDISLEQAISVLLEHTKKIEAVEEVPLLEAPGRVLAEDAVATFDNPPFDRSPLDGYTFAAAGTKGATKEAPAAFIVIGEECAGDFFAAEVPAGSAVRLMTGAAIPKGCDCVVRQEDVTVEDGRIFVPYELHHHENYCFAGEDVRKGTRAVERGTELTAAHLGVLASLGFGTVKVLRRPRVAIASTGDELVLPGEPLRPGKIYNSNLYALAGRLRELGFEPEVLGILPDDAEQAAAVIADWQAKADLFLTTGGVSVGKKDIMHEVVRLIGTRLFWRVCIKPGAPVIAYTVRHARHRALGQSVRILRDVRAPDAPRARSVLGPQLCRRPCGRGLPRRCVPEAELRAALHPRTLRGGHLRDPGAARLGLALLGGWLQCAD